MIKTSRRDFIKVAATGAVGAMAFPSFGKSADAVFQGLEKQSRPNILLIITDQQFADAMSCRMGSQYLHTPNMDALAASGTLFTRAYSTNPLCMPLRNSLFTGRYSHETGITFNNEKAKLDPQRYPCMGSYFRAAGYTAAYSGKWHLCFAEKDQASHGFEILRGHFKLHDNCTTDGAERFLARAHEQPFLLVASYLNPHNICEWARRLAGRQQTLSCGEIGTTPPADQLPPAPLNLEPPKNEPDSMALMRRAFQVEKGPFPVGKFSADDWRRHRWGYYRMVELVDAEIGKLLAALRKAGKENNTLIVFTSDHGECAGAHRWNQKTVFYEESTRVPLIVAWKGKALAAATNDKLINTGVDILPSLLEAAGIAIPAQLPGHSFLPLAAGKSVAAWRDYVVVQNNLMQAGSLDGFVPRMEGRMVRAERYKYCVYSRGQQRESLVDLQADPGEMNDLATNPQYHDILLQHRQMLAQFAQTYHDPLVEKLLADDVKPAPFINSKAEQTSKAEKK